MNVWYAIPTANPLQYSRCAKRWRERGYKLAALIDREEHACVGKDADLLVKIKTWPGYPRATNHLIRVVISNDPEAEWIVTGGDDIDPDPGDPTKIAGECTEYFGGTLGVMQPTGDRWGWDGERWAAERICGSPWLGREFIERAYGGLGVFWPEYYHFFADEELHDWTMRDGLLWQRPDLIHVHHHWSRYGRSRPQYMQKAQARWNSDEALFRRRSAAGFPGATVEAPVDFAVIEAGVERLA